ncbi:unnamed protein product, partial [marine sediment metagenome]
MTKKKNLFLNLVIFTLLFLFSLIYGLSYIIIRELKLGNHIGVILGFINCFSIYSFSLILYSFLDKRKKG